MAGGAVAGAAPSHAADEIAQSKIQSMIGEQSGVCVRERLEHVRGTLVTEHPLLVRRADNHFAQIVAETQAIDRSGRDGRVLVLSVIIHDRLGAERSGPGEQFIVHDADCIHIALEGSFAVEGLGGHVRRRAENGGIPCLQGLALIRETEIRYQQFALAIEHDIGGLEITVDDLCVVDRRQRPEHLAGDQRRQWGLQRAPFGEDILKCAAVHVFHDDVDYFTQFVCMINGNHVGVFDHRGSAGAVDKLPTQLRVTGQSQMTKQFDGYVALEKLVAPSPDHAHPAFTDLLDERDMTQLPRDLGRLRGFGLAAAAKGQRNRICQ